MNEEIEIVCLVASVEIRDLGLRMVKGGKVLTTSLAVARSMDLENEKRRGAVAVRPMRARVLRQESSPHARPESANRKLIARSATTPGAVGSVEVPEPAQSLTQAQVLKGLRDLTEEVGGLREDLRKLPAGAPSLDPTAMAAAVAEAVRGALSGLRFEGGAASVRTVSSEPEPMFIPSGMVPQGGTGHDIQATHSTTGGVDEAEEALKVLRKRRSQGDRNG